MDKVEIIELFNEYNLFETLEEILKNQKHQKENPSKLAQKNKYIPKSKKKISTEIELYQRNTSFYILEIIMISLQIAPSFFRTHIVSQNQKFLKYPFLQLLTESVVNDEDINLRVMVEKTC